MTRKIILFALLLITNFVFAQNVPQGINYQAVIRNNTGTVITNTTVGLAFALYNNFGNTTPVYTETHSAVPTGSIGVATCTIGMGTLKTGTISTVNWSTGDVSYEVFVKVGNGGFTSLGKQKFMSVPYAFYAGSSSSPTLVLSGSNVLSTVGGNSITIPTSSTSSPTITGVGIASVSPTSGNNFTVNVPAPTLTITGNTLGIKQGTATSVVTLPTGSSSTSTIVGTGIASVTPTSGNNFTVNVPAPTLTTAIISGSISAFQFNNGTGLLTFPSIWSSVGNNIYPSSLASSSVGIGTNIPASLFDIKSNAIGLAGDLTIRNQISTNVGPNIQLVGASKIWNISATNNGASSGADKLVFRDYSSAIDRMVIDGSGNVGIGTSNPIYKLTVIDNLSNSSNSAIFGQNNGFSSSNNAHGIYGNTNSTNIQSAAIYGLNTGNGPSIYGNKSSGFSGNAARFILTPPSTSFVTDAAVYIEKSGVLDVPALYAQTNGTGAAVYAKSINGNSPLALEFNGHIKSSQSSTFNAMISSTNTALALLTPSCNNCNDSKGNVTIYNGSSTTINANNGDDFTIKINFDKPYSSSFVPTVIITPYSNFNCFFFYVKTITNSYFEVEFKKEYCALSTVNISPGLFFKFNYFVIE